MGSQVSHLPSAFELEMVLHQAEQMRLDLPPAEVGGQIPLPLLLQEDGDEKPEE